MSANSFLKAPLLSVWSHTTCSMPTANFCRYLYVSFSAVSSWNKGHFQHCVLYVMSVRPHVLLSEPRTASSSLRKSAIILLLTLKAFYSQAELSQTCQETYYSSDRKWAHVIEYSIRIYNFFFFTK